MPAQSERQSASNGFQWKRGEYHTFYSQMKIRVGGHNGTDPVDILQGDEFEYDGSVCKYGGREFPQPQLRGAVREGWATLDPEGRVPAAFSASRDVAVSQSKSTDLSRVQRKPRQVMEKDDLDEDTVLQVSDRSAVRDATSGRGHLSRENNRRTASSEHSPGTFRGLEVSQSDLDDQDAREIAPVRSSAKLKIDVIANPGAAREIEMRSHEQGYGRFDGPRRKNRVVEREGVIITSNVGDVSRDVRSGDASEGKLVGRVRHTASGKTQEGVSVEDTSGSPAARAARAESRARPPAKAAPPSPRPQAKPAPKAASAKPVPSLPPDAPQKLRFAVRQYNLFPHDWNFYAKPEDKMSRVKQLGAQPGLLDALYAVESPAVKKLLEKQFSKHFS